MDLQGLQRLHRSMDSQFCSFSLNVHPCIRSAMAEKIWEKQQSLYLELSCMSACKTLVLALVVLHWIRELLRKTLVLALVVLHWIRELLRRTVARNQLICRGSRPHSCITHQEGIITLTLRNIFNTVRSELGCPSLCPVLRKELTRSGSHTC